MKPQTQKPKARMNKKGQFGINALYVLVFGGLILSLAGIILSIFGLHIITTENGTHTGFVTAISGEIMNEINHEMKVANERLKEE